MSEQRKLATIMAVDVAGYSRAAESDDGAAAEAVARLHAAIEAIIAPQGGRIFNTAGDGFMVEFTAAASGVAAAQALLTEIQVRALPRIRIGLHLGDVIVAPDGDLLGHGVNVAARLQAMAEPNSAVISQPVRAQLRAAVDLPLRSLGRVQLDKMSERIEVFGFSAHGVRFARVGWRRARRNVLALTAIAVLSLAAVGAWRTLIPAAPPQTPRLAVLRFESLGDTEPYFAEGVADELISEVSRIRGMEVTARSSSFGLAGERATPGGAAQQLGATFVLTGSVRRAAASLHVHATLAEAPSGRLVWDQTFDRPLTEVYLLQRDIAVQVARAAGLRVEQSSTQRVDPEAFRLYLQGRELYLRRRELGPYLAEARDLLQASVDRDPNFADAWAMLANAELALTLDSVTPQRPATRPMFGPTLRAAARAAALNPRLFLPRETTSTVWSTLGQWREAAASGEEAVARDGLPYGWRNGTGQFAALVPEARRAASLDPQNENLSSSLGNACFYAGEIACAIAAYRRVMDLNPEHPAVFELFVSLARAGDRHSARAVLDGYPAAWRRIRPTYPTMERRYLLLMITDAPQVPEQDLLALMHRDGVWPGDVIWTLAVTGRIDTAARQLENWGPDHDVWQMFDPGLAPLRARREFWTLMERKGLLAYWRDTGDWPDFCQREPVCQRYSR